ncbi:MAG: hypothetical protein ACWGO2_04015 [Syntrophobacteria bacterium]|jgi:hypothetical protein
MKIWKFNDPEPLRPFLRVLQSNAPHLVNGARRLCASNNESSREDLVCLARGLVDTCPEVRQAVRVLIFSPPVEDELNHFLRLLRWLPDWLPSKWYEQSSVRQSVAELISCVENPQDCRPLATLLEVVLKRSSPAWPLASSLLSGPLPSASRRSLLSLLARRLSYPLKSGLRKRFLEKETLSPGEICEALAASNRLTPMGSLRHWTKMTSVEDLAFCSKVNLYSSEKRVLDKDLRIHSWGQRSRVEIAFLEKLISYQLKEISEVFRLALEVSRSSKRVVITLHNASLGAASGWGAPSFTHQISAEAAVQFSQRVQALRRDFILELSDRERSSPFPLGHSLREQAEDLFGLWGKRLVRPQILQNLWALRVSLLLNGLPLDEWEQLIGQAKEILQSGDHQRLTEGKGLAITFVPPTAARHQVDQTLSWYRKKKKNHSEKLSLLWALIRTGQEWLSSNRLEYLVLPIVDKFFISSKRDQDLDYLPYLVKLIHRFDHTPLFLFIDDTSRASQPSLQLAIDRWRESYPFLGLGVFASERASSQSNLETILDNSSKINLFALRPLTQVHNPIAFDFLLAQRPAEFLSRKQYDSSWKDNLPFLYQGTQVAPFSGGVEQPERFSPFLVTSAGPMFFGTYYRLKLRQLALKHLGFIEEKSQVNDTQSPLELLWSEYSDMANLL